MDTGKKIIGPKGVKLAVGEYTDRHGKVQTLWGWPPAPNKVKVTEQNPVTKETFEYVYAVRSSKKLN